MYNPRDQAEHLVIAPIRKASVQHREECVDPSLCGKCYRFYDYKAIEKHANPKMMTSDIGSVVLQMKHLGIDNLVRFDYMDPPGRSSA